jgi:hypothetical protein
LYNIKQYFCPKYILLSLCLTNWALRHEVIWESGCIHPHFLDLGTSWRWVVSFTPLPLYLREKNPRYPLDRLWDHLQKSVRRKQMCLCLMN